MWRPSEEKEGCQGISGSVKHQIGWMGKPRDEMMWLCRRKGSEDQRVRGFVDVNCMKGRQVNCVDLNFGKRILRTVQYTSYMRM